MSNLDYPISVLTEERDNIYGLPKSRADKLQRAIDILNDQKERDEKIKRLMRLIKMRSGIVDNKNINVKI